MIVIINATVKKHVNIKYSRVNVTFTYTQYTYIIVYNN